MTWSAPVPVGWYLGRRVGVWDGRGRVVYEELALSRVRIDASARALPDLVGARAERAKKVQG